MSRRFRLKDLLPSKRVPPVAPLSKDYYLTVMAARQPLPIMAAIAAPKGANEAVPGFIVPLSSGAEKSDLARPLARGTYGIASPDQKTVLRLTVVPTDEVGFDAAAVAQDRMADRLGQEDRARLAATWTLLQLQFESFDPALFPALSFFLQVAQRLTELTDGVLADPLSRRYLSASEIYHVPPPGLSLNMPDVIGIHVRPDGDRFALATAGMAKVSHPELDLPGVGAEHVELAELFLLGLAHGVWRGQPLELGALVGEAEGLFRLIPGGRDAGWWGKTVPYELTPENHSTAGGALEAWRNAAQS